MTNYFYSCEIKLIIYIKNKRKSKKNMLLFSFLLKLITKNENKLNEHYKYTILISFTKHYNISVGY